MNIEVGLNLLDIALSRTSTVSTPIGLLLVANILIKKLFCNVIVKKLTNFYGPWSSSFL